MQVIKSPQTKTLDSTRSRIHCQIVQPHNLRQVGQIILSNVLVEVVKHMVNFRWLPPMVKSGFVVWQNEDESASGASYPLPFL